MIEYCRDFNPERAARAAGYTGRVDISASRLMRSPSIKRAINRHLAMRAQRHEVNVDRTIIELGKIAFANITDFVDIDASPGEQVVRKQADWDRDKAAAIQQVEVHDRYNKNGDFIGRITKVRMHPKTEALSLLLKHMGALASETKLKVEGQVQHTLNLDGARGQINKILEGLASRAQAHAEPEHEPLTINAVAEKPEDA